MIDVDYGHIAIEDQCTGEAVFYNELTCLKSSFAFWRCCFSPSNPAR
jgi:hypothetical protein